jgi:hypothetical protein
MSPTDGSWEVETLPAGELLSEHREVPEEFEWAYLRWAEGSRAESGAAVIHALPPGDYYLVRSEVEPVRAHRVLIGNEWVLSPANTRVLLDEKPLYAMLIGPEPYRPPVTTHPLIAMMALNYTGYSGSQHGALFFDAVARAEEPPDPSGELVYVIPAAGEFVVDVVGQFSAENSVINKAAWRDTGAHQLAKAFDSSWL